MPPMGHPYRGWPDTGSRNSKRDDGSDRRATSLRLRLGTAVHRAKLTRLLAEGADPIESGELELRARQLTSARSRKAFARSLRRAVAEAHRPARTRSAVPIIDRGAVLDAEAAIAEMIERLLAPQPVQARGMARLERILTNADRSPLYNPSEAGTLRHTIRSTTAALDMQLVQSHEFALAV
jgi:hypothetical protein